MKLVKDLRGHFHVKGKGAAKRKIGIVLAMTMLTSLLMCGTAFASGGDTGTIDESVFTTLVNGAKAILGLFTLFPINVFLAASILLLAVGIVKKVKGA